MNINDLFPSKYVKADDLKGQRVPLTIMSVTVEEIADGEQKPVMRFIGKEKGMVLNKTNGLSLAVAFGEDTIQWQGREIELLAMPTHFNGKQVMGLVTLPMGVSTAPAVAGGFGADSTRSARGDTPSGPHDFPSDAELIQPQTAKGAAQKEMERLAAEIDNAETTAGVDEIPF